jgi:hypothetical protein
MVREVRRLVPDESNSGPFRRDWDHARPAAMPDPQRTDTSVSRRVGRGENPSTGTDLQKPHWRDAPISRERRMAAAALVAFAGLCVGMLSVGIAIQGVLAESKAPDVAEADVPGEGSGQLEVGSPPADPPKEPQVPLDPVPARADPPAVTESNGLANHSVTETPSKPKVPAPPPPPPVKVKLAAGDFGYLHVKIGSKTYLLEPGKDIELTPGKYRMRIRKDGADWQTVTVKIPKKPCRVVFKKPKSVEITDL